MYSTKWKTWKSSIDIKTCKPCRERHGKIYHLSDAVIPAPPLHINCRCIIEKLQSIFAGTATSKGLDGADWYLKHYHKLPAYYITKKDANTLGWVSSKGNLYTVAPNKMIFGGVFSNSENKLPSANNRIWYEADINYNNGRRNSERILFSSDGLIFVTYDHYKTFIEVE